MAAEPRCTIKDAVATDNIWKDYVRGLTKCQIKTWPVNWGWTIDEYNKLYEAMAGKRPLSPFDPRAADQLHKDPASLVGEPEGKGKSRRKGISRVFLPPLPQAGKKSTLPQTTTGWYGYLPKIQGHSLVTERQKWCKVTVGQHNLTRLFNWPDIYD